MSRIASAVGPGPGVARRGNTSTASSRCGLRAQVAGDQEPFVNRAIAALGLAVITRLCQRRLTWRATYFDLEVGTLQYTHVDPHDVARLVGIRTDSLLRRSSRPPIRSA